MSASPHEQILEGIKSSVGHDCGLGKKVKFVIDGAGTVSIDATLIPNTVTSSDLEADCTLRISLDDFVAMINDEVDATELYLLGKLKIEGDLVLATQLSSVLTMDS